LYERKTLEAVGLLERVPVDDLWTGTDEAINVRRVEKWNAIKAKMGETYERNKILVSQAFPTQPIDAIYKKCNHCGCVYVKPTGCDFGTTCGQSKSGADSLPFTYEYMEGSNARFDILEKSSMGTFEALAYRLRRSFASMVSNNSDSFYGGGKGNSKGHSGAVVQEHGFEKGCGRSIKWETMKPLTLEELQRFGLVPEGVDYAVTITETAGVSKKDMSMNIKMKQVAAETDIDTDQPFKQQVQEALEQLGMVQECRGKPLKEQVDMLYDLIVS